MGKAEYKQWEKDYNETLKPAIEKSLEKLDLAIEAIKAKKGLAEQNKDVEVAEKLTKMLENLESTKKDAKQKLETAQTSMQKEYKDFKEDSKRLQGQFREALKKLPTTNVISSIQSIEYTVKTAEMWDLKENKNPLVAASYMQGELTRTEDNLKSAISEKRQELDILRTNIESECDMALKVAGEKTKLTTTTQPIQEDRKTQMRRWSGANDGVHKGGAIRRSSVSTPVSTATAEKAQEVDETSRPTMGRK